MDRKWHEFGDNGRKFGNVRQCSAIFSSLPTILDHHFRTIFGHFRPFRSCFGHCRAFSVLFGTFRTLSANSCHFRSIYGPFSISCGTFSVISVIHFQPFSAIFGNFRPIFGPFSVYLRSIFLPVSTIFGTLFGPIDPF